MFILIVRYVIIIQKAVKIPLFGNFLILLFFSLNLLELFI